MANREKFKALVSDEKTNTVARNRARIKNRARLRESQDIALKVLTKLDELNWSQKRLAKEMGVSPQQITKIVKGKENLTLETQTELQSILDIPILASYYEKTMEDHLEKIISEFQVSDTEKYATPVKQISNLRNNEILFPKKTFKLKYDVLTGNYEDYKEAV